MQPAQNSLYSLVLTLTPTTRVSVKASMGDQVHGAFLRTVEQADPELAEMLHRPRTSVRPFAVSPLWGVPGARDGRVWLSPEDIYWLRVAILHPPVFRGFMARFLDPTNRPAIRVGRAELLIREILVTPGSHPWAGYTTWGTLARDAATGREIVLDFVTPTAFGFGQRSWGKKAVVLPQPELVFGSLVKSWNALAPPELGMDASAVVTYAGEDVVVARLKGLETRMHQFKHAPQVGFVGRVTYRLKGGDENMWRQFNALADFAFYAGVGMKRTMGMGMVSRVVN